MSINKKNIIIKYKGSYGFWRIANLVVLGLLAAGIMAALLFIYQSIYITSVNTAEILELRSSMNLFNIDLHAYEEAKSLIATKNAVKDIRLNNRNVFFYSTSSSIVTGTFSYDSIITPK